MGASPIIRIPSAEEWMIKRALDSGAHGVMTPMCNTAVSDAKGWARASPVVLLQLLRWAMHVLFVHHILSPIMVAVLTLPCASRTCVGAPTYQ